MENRFISQVFIRIKFSIISTSANYTSLTITRYPVWATPFALTAMVLFNIPLWLNKRISFYKLMGSGKKGTFNKKPDWQQWAILQVGSVPEVLPPEKELLPVLYGKFIAAYWRLFRCETITYVLQPIEGHGTWSGKEPFGQLPRKTDYEGKIAVLTRAAIHRKKLKRFWSHVDPVAQRMYGAEGFILSYGIGELPYIRQATFSLWQSKEAMRQFAYKMPEHADVVKKTHAENWYSEELFVRFKLIKSV